jgi:hypothetical protein
MPAPSVHPWRTLPQPTAWGPWPSKVRDILRRNPDLPKAGVAKYAGVSSRTVERVIGATG